jgi:hypothetical protein
MTTRYYLPSGTSTTDIAPSYDSAWEDTTSYAAGGRQIHRKDVSNTTTEFRGGLQSDLTDQDVLMKQFVGRFPLTAGQTITGSQALSASIYGGEANTNNNLFLSIGIRIIASDGTTVRKTVCSVTRAGNELPTSGAGYASRYWTATSASGNYTTVAGDYLVIEIGVGGDPSADGHWASVYFGDESAQNDLDAADGDTTYNDRPWVQLTDTLTYGPLVTPTTKALVLTTYAPTVSVSANQTATPTTLALTLTTYAPSVVVNNIVTPTTLALTLTTYAPSVVIDNIVTPTTLTLALTTYEPTVTTAPPAVTNGRIPTIGFLSQAIKWVTLLGFHTRETGDKVVIPTTLGLTLTTYAPTVTVTPYVVPTTVDLVLTTYAPTVTATTLVVAVPTTLALTLTTYAPTVTIGTGKGPNVWMRGGVTAPKKPTGATVTWDQRRMTGGKVVDPGLIPASPALSVATGTFNGNGTSVAVTGVGFAPDVVILSAADSENIPFRHDGEKVHIAFRGLTKVAEFGSEGQNPCGWTAADCISFDSDGFTVTEDFDSGDPFVPGSHLNCNGGIYQYIALTNVDGAMAWGEWTGTGALKTIDTGLGDQLEAVMTFKVTGDSWPAVPENKPTGWMKLRNMTGWTCQPLAASFHASNGFDSRISALNADGTFDIGAGNENISGQTYYWLAFTSAGGMVSTGETGLIDADGGTEGDGAFTVTLSGVTPKAVFAFPWDNTFYLSTIFPGGGLWKTDAIPGFDGDLFGSWGIQADTNDCTLLPLGSDSFSGHWVFGWPSGDGYLPWLAIGTTSTGNTTVPRFIRL